MGFLNFLITNGHSTPYRIRNNRVCSKFTIPALYSKSREERRENNWSVRRLINDHPGTCQSEADEFAFRQKREEERNIGKEKSAN
jgi:hypothetical protein